MIADPLYRKIVDGLSRDDLDDQVFERCAADLLREPYPTLVPVAGGGDAGMDGAIGTSQGAYPLVCTVGKDALANLRHNLQTYFGTRPGPRRAVFATTRALTPLRRRNLEDAAAKLGVTLVNVHEQTDLALRIYRAPRWRMELLGIVGDPPALSVLPVRGRYDHVPGLPVGRDEVIAWLRTTPGDLLVVGQPGSGKSYLHQHLAAAGFCLFVVDWQPGRLADAIREQRPKVVVVDDAHVEPERLRALLRLRAEVGEKFAVHANCWPKWDREVRAVLSVGADAVRTLDPLNRDQVLTLVRAHDIGGPDALLQLLLDQAGGMPGLAAALCAACKLSDVGRVWSGEALADLVLHDRRIVPDERARSVLAAFAVGGEGGMPWPAVAAVTGLTPADLRAATAGLGAGGVVEEVVARGVGDGGGLRVRPEALAALLVRDVFFAAGVALDPRPLLAAAPSPADAAHVLMAARQRGAAVPLGLLEPLLVAAVGRESVWEHFAWVDVTCARAVVERHPERASAAAPGLLHFLPTEALRLLLDADAAGGSALGRSTHRPRERVQQWLVPHPDLPSGVAVERRRLLLSVFDSLRRDPTAPPAPATVAWGLGEVMRPDYSGVRAKPGSGREFVHIQGVLVGDDLTALFGLWPRILQNLERLPIREWRPVLNGVEGWCLPRRFTRMLAVPPDTDGRLLDAGRRMVADLAAVPAALPTLRTWAAQLNRRARLGLTLPPEDDLLAALFAERDHTPNWQAAAERRQSELRGLAARLAGRPASNVAAELARVEREVAEFGGLGGGHDRASLYYFLAEAVDRPGEWCDALVGQEASPGFVQPVLAAAGDRSPADHERRLRDLLDRPAYAALAVQAVLTAAEAPQALVAEASARLAAPPDARDDHWMMGWQLSEEVAKLLLRHPVGEVRAAAVLAEWGREHPHGNVRPGVMDAWRAAMPEVRSSDPYLAEVLQGHPALASAWTRRLLSQIEPPGGHDAAGVESAVGHLSVAERRELILLVGRENYQEECFDALVGEDAFLYAEWFTAKGDDRHLALKPLYRVAGPRWERMALAALDAGMSSDEIAHYCTPTHWSGTGSMSSYFREVLPAYERLAAHPDARLRPAGRCGLEWARRGLQDAVDRERREAVYGA